MGIGERSWMDRTENYADGYTLTINASTADNVLGVDIKAPVVVYSLTVACSQANASGEVALVDGSATADSGDTRRFRAVMTSAGATTKPRGWMHADFPRGLVFETGLIVSAATCTGAVNITYKRRYS